MNINDVLKRLSKVRRTGKGFSAVCPSHDDTRPSLSVCEEDGKVLLHCHTGCSVQSIVKSMGLQMSDLFRSQKELPKKRMVATYDYKDETGKLLYEVIRYEPKSFHQRRPVPGGWLYNRKGVRRVVYRLPELIASSPNAIVFIVEGEKDADCLISLGLVATCNPGGAGKWRADYAVHFEDRIIVIIPDNDPAGEDHASDVAHSLHKVSRSVKIVRLPNLIDKGDVSDWIKSGGTLDELTRIANNSAEWTPNYDSQQEETTSSVKDARTGAGLLIELAQLSAEFFHDADNNCYCTARIKDHSETFRLDSRACGAWLRGLYFHETGEAISNDGFARVLNQLQSVALYTGVERETFLRLTGVGDRVYLDLCDPSWRIVEIKSDGWKVLAASEAPVRFIRKRAMQALPLPVSGGDVSELRKFLNPGITDSDWALIAGFLVMTFHPTGPYPVLVLHGEQGSAKTTTSRMIRRVIDPSRADVRSTPKKEEDLIIAASNSWMLAFDNLSGISSELGDQLCRITTGTGFGTRELYSNYEEVVFSVKRPIIINGIEDNATRSDLLDRCVSTELPSIPETDRREEADLWREYDEARPRILGALLSAASHALANLENTRLERKPRMADFARWGVAAEPALNLTPGSFIEAYTGNRESSHSLILEESPAAEIKDFFDSIDGSEWSGRMSALLLNLTAHCKERGKDIDREKGWPRKPQQLSRLLKRFAPNLRAAGIDLTITRTKVGSVVLMRKITFSFSEKSSPSS